MADAALPPPATIDIRERVKSQAGRLRRVKRIDRLAVGFITFGGMFIIVAVLFIFVFILGEALPLFRPASGEARGAVTLAALPPLERAGKGAGVIGGEGHRCRGPGHGPDDHQDSKGKREDGVSQHEALLMWLDPS